MKCITCNDKIIVNKENKQPYGAVSVILMPTPSSKHGLKEKELKVNAPQGWVNVTTNPLYGFVCDNCLLLKNVLPYNNFINKI